MAMRGPRLQVGSGPWITEERSCALQIAQSEIEEFSYSARNELDWLNEHMAGIFDENQTKIAEAFKTPGKLRGKTPRTARKNPAEARVPLSDVFAPTPNGSTNRFAQHLHRIQSPKSHAHVARSSPSPVKNASKKLTIFSPKPIPPVTGSQDSGYYGSQDVASQGVLRQSLGASQQADIDRFPLPSTTTIPLKQSPSRNMVDSPEKTFQTAKEDQTTRVLLDANTMISAVGPSDATSEHNATEEDEMDVPTSPQSDGSSPIRAVVRKSSLNFASLPAREPLAAGKSNGARVSRTSHLDHNRMSYYGRPTGGKSLGNHAWREVDDEDEDHEGDINMDKQPNLDEKPNPVLNHNKTYTQRLQDQINQLGKSAKSSRLSKSNTNIAALQQNAVSSQSAEGPRSPSPKHISPTKSTPGAFPDDDDDWIEPPAPAPAAEKIQSPRPTLPKSVSVDVMEGIDRDRIGDVDFAPSTTRIGQSASPTRVPTSHGQTVGHAKSASVSTIALTSHQIEDQTLPLAKAITISNPTMNSIAEMGAPETPSKSPSRGFRDSPLKQVKNKLSSILKSSRGLLASSAAISAEGKTSILSPSTSRLALHAGPSTESVLPKPSFESLRSKLGGFNDSTVTLPVAKRTRASVEREKEEKRLEKEAKRMEEQMSKLEKAREKEREKARVFSKEQERIATMQKQISSKNTDGRTLVKETPKPVRSSPRKQQREPEEAMPKPVDEDVDMTDATGLMPPPTAPRSAGPQQVARGKEIKRPIRPTKDTQARAKQAPTVIKVNTGSQHSQYHLPTGNVSAVVPETPGNVSSQHQSLASKASKASLQKKPSTQSLKGSASIGRPKALDLAAKKKEQDEREAQRRREAKAEMDRKRAAAQEEQRRQEQQRLETERQRQKDREMAAAVQPEQKQNAQQRQAMIEKAKHTRAPPPAVRSQPNGPPDFSNISQDKAPANQTRPASRMNSGIQRPHEESSRPVNAVLSNASKAGMKRTLGADASNDIQGQPRPASRAGPSYQAKDAKRRRTSQDHDELNDDNPPNIKGPPLRPSVVRKELPKKSLFQNGYATAQPGATRDLFKATVTAQHSSQSKAGHPLDMAQISKGGIPFAPNPNPAASHSGSVRPAAASSSKSAPKAAPKSSPRFQNGDSIELPEIQTDDEDEDEEEAGGITAAWADSPFLRKALVDQETIDPSQIFGPAAPLNMEEVFSKSKDRWHKFRARTSSANWSGSDRLTEDDIRKDLAARDKLRREGGWSYEMSREML